MRKVRHWWIRVHRSPYHWSSKPLPLLHGRVIGSHVCRIPSDLLLPGNVGILHGTQQLSLVRRVNVDLARFPLSLG